jgi:2-polyprenyl-6-hydroxyphenyl methylase/3-demethylubiquinone-9 3-methyltransferase
MKSAHELSPRNPEEKRLRAFDLAEIDAVDRRSHFSLKYRARLHAVLAAALRFVPTGGSILEVGCAQANASLLLAERGFTTVGLDLRPESLGYARRKYERGPFYTVCADARHLPFRKASFDAIIVGELLEHCAQPAAILRSLGASLRPGGHVIITTPNGQRWASPDRTYDAAAALPLDPYAGGFAGEHHLFVFTVHQLARVVREAGLTPVQVRLVGSMLHSDRLMAIKRLLPAQLIELLASAACAMPFVGLRTAMTIVMVAAHGTR